MYGSYRLRNHVLSQRRDSLFMDYNTLCKKRKAEIHTIHESRRSHNASWLLKFENSVQKCWLVRKRQNQIWYHLFDTSWAILDFAFSWDVQNYYISPICCFPIKYFLQTSFPLLRFVSTEAYTASLKLRYWSSQKRMCVTVPSLFHWRKTYAHKPWAWYQRHSRWKRLLNLYQKNEAKSRSLSDKRECKELER